MNDDTLQILRQRVDISRDAARVFGKLQAEATWDRCLKAAERLRAGKSFQVEFALLLAKAQYRMASRPPKQATLPAALWCAAEKVWQCLWVDLSRRPSLKLVAIMSWNAVRFWIGRAWPAKLYEASPQSAVVEAFVGSFTHELEERYRRALPVPAWLKNFLGVAAGMVPVAAGLGMATWFASRRRRRR